MEAKTWHGHWWEPEHQDRKLPGVLRVDETGLAQLDLIGGFDLQQREALPEGGWSVSGRTRDLPVLHGEAEGVALTLLNSFNTHSRGLGLFLGAPSFMQLHVNQVLAGAWIESADAAVFRSARMTFENFAVWLGAGTAEATINWNDRVSTAALRELPAQSVTVLGTEFSAVTPIGTFKFDRRRDRIQLAGDTTAYLKVEPAEPSTLEYFNRIAADVMDLLTLATGVPCGLISSTLTHVESEEIPRGSDPPWVKPIEIQVISRRVHQANGDAPAIAAQDMRFSCQDEAFAVLLARWLPLAKRVQAASDVYFGAYYARPTFTDTRLLFGAIAAESLHKALAPAATRNDPTEFAARKARVIGALEDERDVRWAEQALSNALSYADRLRALLRLPDPPAVELIVPDQARWVRDMRASRNGLAHDGRADKIDIFELADSVMDLLALVYMSELGLSAEVQLRSAERLRRQ